MIAAHDPNIVYLLQRYAEESGFKAIKASQSKDILDLARHTNPALIILDIEMPGMACENVLRRLKTEPATRHIPVIIYSCLDEQALDQEGAAGYLQKSIMYDDFLAVLKHTGIYS